MLDGEEWVINGNKVFTSGANQADYIWLACRTDPDAQKHKGISMIIVPTVVAGVQDDADRDRRQRRHPGDATTTTFGCRAENVVGEVNGGWRLITNQLNHERVGLAALAGLTFRLFDDVLEWCRRHRSGASGGRMIDVPWVQLDLARAHAKLEAMKLLNWRMAAAVANGTLTPTDASAAKVFGVETQIEVYRICCSASSAPVGTCPPDRPGAVLHGEVERAARAAQINTFGGGVVEVLREIVATAGLR